jgi:hypothetical protein
MGQVHRLWPRTILLVVPLLLTLHPRGTSAQPRVVVVPFGGPGATAVRAGVVRELRGQLRLVRSALYYGTARRLRVHPRKARGVRRVCKELDCQVVVTGYVRRRRGYRVRLYVIDGASGSQLARLVARAKRRGGLRAAGLMLGRRVLRVIRDRAAPLGASDAERQDEQGPGVQQLRTPSWADEGLDEDEGDAEADGWASAEGGDGGDVWGSDGGSGADGTGAHGSGAVWGGADGGSQSGVALHGFAEFAAASRVRSDPSSNGELLLVEGRFRLDVEHQRQLGSLRFSGDFVADAQRGDFSIDLRQAQLTFQPVSWLEVRAGQQVLTWGTGDLVFLNDLFPKDFVSFFNGRDDEYLKAPSLSLKLSLFTALVHLDLVWTPIFTPDRFITGERLSFYSPEADARVGGARLVDDLRPEKGISNGELAGRLHRTLAGWELALYGYLGFNKQPLARGSNGEPTYSRLGVYGASVRGALLGGVLNVEGAYYHAIDDPHGDDPRVPNPQLRGLIGFEREIVALVTLGVQYYAELTFGYDALARAALRPAALPDELRHVLTLRLTAQLLRQDLTLSLFAFLEPSSDYVDSHLRPVVRYKLTDSVSLAAGANWLLGARYGFFGQLKHNTNVYLRGRYTF